MNKETRDLTKLEAVKYIYNNNPGKIYVHHYNHLGIPAFMVSKIPISDLKFPDGWTYNENDGISRNGNSAFTDCCCSFSIKIVEE